MKAHAFIHMCSALHMYNDYGMTSVCCAWIKWKSHLTTSTKRKKQVAKCLRAKAKTHPYTECTDGKQRHRHWIHKSEWRSSILVKLFTVCCNKRVSRIWRNFNLFPSRVFFRLHIKNTHILEKHTRTNKWPMKCIKGKHSGNIFENQLVF